MAGNPSPVPGKPSAPERALNTAELEDFLDREFDGEPGLGAEYPLLIGAHNARRRWISRVAGEIAAHAAWRPLRLRSSERTLQAAGIGLVTTGRRWRGRGLAGQLVERCVAEARAEGAELALLFASPRSLYRRSGFVPAGRERILPLTPRARTCTARPASRRGDPTDAARLLPLLEAHSLGVERSREEFQALLSIPRTELWLLEREARVLAYAVCGKGRDLRGVVHEWGGSPEATAELLDELARLGAQAALAPEPTRLPGVGPGRVGPLAQIRVLAHEQLGSEDPVRLFGDAHTPARIPLYIWGLDSF